MAEKEDFGASQAMDTRTAEVPRHPHCQEIRSQRTNLRTNLETLGFEKISPASYSWEVLNGVGVDAVGVIFPLIFFRIFSLFSSLLLKDKGKQHQFTAKMGNFTPTPSAPTRAKLPDTESLRPEVSRDRP